MGDLQLDPEVRELIAEIAADPRSTLFHAGAIAPLRVSPLADIPTASAGTAGWTPAEKHLLSVCREEAAAFVRQGFRAKLLSDKRASCFFDSPESPPDPTETRGLEGPAREVLDAESFQRVVAGRAAGTAVTLSQLSTILARIEASPASIVYGATSLLLSGDPPGAERLLLTLLEDAGLSTVNRVCGLATLGLAQSLTPDRADSAASTYARLCQLDPEDPRIAGNAFLCALNAGVEPAARLAACRLEEHGESSLLSDWTEQHGQRLASGLLHMRADSVQLFRRLETSLGPISGAIGHALLQP